MKKPVSMISSENSRLAEMISNQVRYLLVCCEPKELNQTLSQVQQILQKAYIASQKPTTS